MLIDPFLNSEPALSELSTGIWGLRGDTVGWLSGVRTLLEDAGWDQTGRTASTAIQSSYRFFFPATSPPVPPVPKVPYPGSPCTDPLANKTAIGGLEYYPYDQYRYHKPPPCRNRIFYPMGPTPWDTAETLAAEMTGTNPFLVTVHGDPEGLVFEFHLETKSPAAFEFDVMLPPRIGWGSGYLSMGSYTFRSPAYLGGWLEIELMDRAVGWFGGAGGYFTDDTATLGSLQPYVIVRSSAGVYESPYYPMIGPHYGCANPYQVVLWSEATGHGASALLASMLKPDAGHTGANPVLIVGSENNEPTFDYQQLIQKQHWENALGSGYDNEIHAIGYRTAGPNPDGDVRSPTLLARGLRNQGLLTLVGTRLASAPYILMSRDPNGVTAPTDQGDYIAGRLWDMVVMSDSQENAGTILHNGVQYQLLSSGLRANDLRTSLWLKQTED
jgi:hypothetical protein